VLSFISFLPQNNSNGNRMNKSKLARFLTTRIKRFLTRLAGVVMFTLLAAIGVSFWFSLMAALGSKTETRWTAGLEPHFINIYLMIMIIISVGIILSTCGTIVGLLQGAAWAVWTVQLASVLFILFGGFQIYTALSNPGMPVLTVSMSGAAFMLIGLAVYGLGTSIAKS
jgi:hypothetical protein